MGPKANQNYIGIDLSKNNIDVCWHDRRTARFDNTAKGIGAFIGQVKKTGLAMSLVCEATGGYERLLVRAAHEAKIAVCVVNPARVRHFAKGKGILAKTDRIDASVLQAFGAENQPRPARIPRPAEEKLQAWMVRRTQLTDALAREKKRLANSSELVSESIQRMIQSLKEEIALVEKQLEEALESDTQLVAKADVLSSVCGVGPVTIWTILAFMSELGEVNRRRVASLAGLVPWPYDSGDKQGRRFIYGGRTRVRNVLYMATTTACQYNPHLRTYYQRLLATGKPHKVALVAAMRKLLVHLNALLQKERKQLA